MTATSAKRVSLVLGSGGARGYTHIGAIEELHARGYRLVGVSGSSMGALVGGLHAAGKLDEFGQWARSLTQGAVLRLLDPSFAAAGVLRAEKILDVVRDLVGDVAIEQLPIPYTAVATDLITGKMVWLQRGPLTTAIRASIAIPGVIAPHVVDGRLLADGGILDPLPMAPVAAVNADLTIAVSLTGDDAETEHDARPGEGRGATAEWLNRVWRSTAALLDTNTVRSVLDRPTARAVRNRFLSAEPDPDPDGGGDGSSGAPRLGGFEVMSRTIDIAQSALARHHLAIYPPDVLIEVPRDACRSLDFHRAAELIELGRKLTAQALDRTEAGTGL